MREIVVVGRTVRVEAPQGVEKWEFSSPAEALAKAAFVQEALSWIGTPWRHMGDIKGPGGCVDCAMFLVRCAVDTGLREQFDPRPYPQQWMLHREEERFLGWVEKVAPRRVDTPRFGDVVVYRFGRCFSHGGIIVNSEEIVHAYAQARMCILSRRNENLLSFIGHGSIEIPRPVRFYDVWSG